MFCTIVVLLDLLKNQLYDTSLSSIKLGTTQSIGCIFQFHSTRSSFDSERMSKYKTNNYSRRVPHTWKISGLSTCKL